MTGDKPKRQRFKRYPIGFFHIDIAELRTAEGKLYLFVAIDRTSKFAVAQLVDKANRKTAWDFLAHLLEVVPYRIHTILTDNGIQFAEQPRNRNTIYARPMRFDMICGTTTTATISSAATSPTSSTPTRHHRKVCSLSSAKGKRLLDVYNQFWALAIL